MKSKVSIPLDEQEMHIYYSPVSKQCEVYTTIPYMMKYLERMVEKNPEQCRLVKDDQYSYTVEVPFSSVKPRNPRVMTEEQKAAASERMKKLRERTPLRG